MTQTKKKINTKKFQLIPRPLLFPKRRGEKKDQKFPPLFLKERGQGVSFRMSTKCRGEF